MIFVELATLKLGVFGWSLILAWLCGKRASQAYSGTPYNQLIRPLGGPTALAFSTVLAISNIIGYFTPVVDSVVYGDFYSRHPYAHLISIIGVLICLAVMVDRFAFSRRFKLTWEIGWLIFVHVMIWGREWLAS